MANTFVVGNLAVVLNPYAAAAVAGLTPAIAVAGLYSIIGLGDGSTTVQISPVGSGAVAPITVPRTAIANTFAAQ